MTVLKDVQIESFVKQLCLQFNFVQGRQTGNIHKYAAKEGVASHEFKLAYKESEGLQKESRYDFSRASFAYVGMLERLEKGQLDTMIRSADL